MVTTSKERGFIPEILGEIRETMGRAGVAGGILPPVAFLTIHPLAGVVPAVTASLIVAGVVIGFRAARGSSIRFAVSGAVGAVIAALFALRQGSSEAYFLPGILSGAATTVALLVSILVRRPLVAVTSWITRGWPAAWYWHGAVRPAYSLATWLWVGFFGGRTLWQWQLYRDADAAGLLVARVLGGWPATVALLVVTYAIGRWRLRALAGPSVDEFLSRAPAPWVGQQRGF